MGGGVNSELCFPSDPTVSSYVVWTFSDGCTLRGCVSRPCDALLLPSELMGGVHGKKTSFIASCSKSTTGSIFRGALNTNSFTDVVLLKSRLFGSE